MASQLGPRCRVWKPCLGRAWDKRESACSWHHCVSWPTPLLSLRVRRFTEGLHDLFCQWLVFIWHWSSPWFYQSLQDFRTQARTSHTNSTSVWDADAPASSSCLSSLHQRFATTISRLIRPRRAICLWKVSDSFKWNQPNNLFLCPYRIKMAQLTNKCNDEDIEYYVRECGDILGVTQNVENPDDPKAILHYIFQEIIKYKCSNLSWTNSYNDAYSAARGGNRSLNDSNEANNDGASANDSHSDIPQINAIWSVRLALHLTHTESGTLCCLVCVDQRPCSPCVPLTFPYYFTRLLLLLFSLSIN